MKKYVLSAILLFLVVSTSAFERVTFTMSKPLCLLTFLQAANGTGSVSPALSAYIKKHISGYDSAAFYQVVNEFSEIAFRTSYIFPGYPERRQMPKTVLDMITRAAVQSSDLDEFFGRIVGILPNEQWMKLRNVMRKIDPYYDKMIFQPYKNEIESQLAELRKFNDKTDAIFSKLKHFYGSTWGDDMPFTISIYPVPGSNGTTTATPHSNSIVLAVLNKRKDYANSASVAVHEICHVLYQEQPFYLQIKIDSFFQLSNSAYKLYAYNYIDEALATACGNGWAYKKLSGHTDTTNWYNDNYIDGYAHAIYPLVNDYIEKGEVLDKDFVDKAIAIFGQTFPGAIYDYQTMLSRINLYTDAESDVQYQQVTSVLNKYFNISGCAGAYPITDPQALDMIGQATNAQVFIVYTNHQKNYEALKAKFPELKKYDAGREGIINFLDGNKRPVIIVNVSSLDRLESGIKKLAASHKMDPGKAFIGLE